MCEKRKLKNIELKRLSVQEFKKADKKPIIIVLDNIRSLNNIGSVFRTADAFRIDSILLCGITGKPPHREIHKTALGATESVNWNYYEKTSDAILGLKNEGYKIAAIEQMENSIYLDNYHPGQNGKLALVFGNEINGISEDILQYMDFCIEIPQFGTKHSFNIVISAGIVLWHLYMVQK